MLNQLLFSLLALMLFFTAKDMLNVLVLSQITHVDEIVRRNFLGF